MSDYQKLKVAFLSRAARNGEESDRLVATGATPEALDKFAQEVAEQYAIDLTDIIFQGHSEGADITGDITRFSDSLQPKGDSRDKIFRKTLDAVFKNDLSRSQKRPKILSRQKKLFQILQEHGALEDLVNDAKENKNLLPFAARKVAENLFIESGPETDQAEAETRKWETLKDLEDARIFISGQPTIRSLADEMEASKYLSNEHIEDISDRAFDIYELPLKLAINGYLLEDPANESDIQNLVTLITAPTHTDSEKNLKATTVKHSLDRLWAKEEQDLFIALSKHGQFGTLMDYAKKDDTDLSPRFVREMGKFDQQERSEINQLARFRIEYNALIRELEQQKRQDEAEQRIGVKKNLTKGERRSRAAKLRRAEWLPMKILALSHKTNPATSSPDADLIFNKYTTPTVQQAAASIRKSLEEAYDSFQARQKEEFLAALDHHRILDLLPDMGGDANLSIPSIMVRDARNYLKKNPRPLILIPDSEAVTGLEEQLRADYKILDRENDEAQKIINSYIPGSDTGQIQELLAEQSERSSRLVKISLKLLALSPIAQNIEPVVGNWTAPVEENDATRNYDFVRTSRQWQREAFETLCPSELQTVLATLHKRGILEQLLKPDKTRFLLLPPEVVNAIQLFVEHSARKLAAPDNDNIH